VTFFSFRASRLSAVLLVMLYLASISLPIVLAVDENISTEKGVYVVGDVIKFSGSGLNPDTEYTLEILHDGSVIYSKTFNSTSGGSLPTELCWDSSSGDPGTYLVRLLDSNGSVVAESTFGLVEINESKFLPHDSITIVGGGAGANGMVNILIIGDSGTIFNASVTADENGEFNTTIRLPFNITTGNYSIEIQVMGVTGVSSVVFPIFVNATAGNMINVTSTELRDVIALISGLNATIRQSLLAKLQNALKKLEQAKWHLSHNRTHVAKNMLNAAGNILHALLNEINAQSGKHLDNETANSMTSSVQGIISKLEVTKSNLNGASEKHGKAAKGESTNSKNPKWGHGGHESHGKMKGKNKWDHVLGGTHGKKRRNKH